MTLVDRIAAALVDDDQATREAAIGAEHGLRAWRAMPAGARLAYSAEGRRMARRAATAVVAMLVAAEKFNTTTRSATR
jgi:hypothetical protein